MDEDEFKKVVNVLFDEYDNDKDGTLEREEVQLMIKDLGQRKQRNMTAESLNKYVTEYIKKADTNRDGKINKDEFYNFYRAR
jgi:Ca2+-binding EF-hand superfamily protein